MGTDMNTALEVAVAAETNVVNQIVAAELADALDNLWMVLDDKLVHRGVSEKSIAAALHPYGLSEAWLREWCGHIASQNASSPRSVIEVAEEFLVWIDEVLEQGRRSEEGF